MVGIANAMQHDLHLKLQLKLQGVQLALISPVSSSIVEGDSGILCGQRDVKVVNAGVEKILTHLPIFF